MIEMQTASVDEATGTLAGTSALSDLVVFLFEATPVLTPFLKA